MFFDKSLQIFIVIRILQINSTVNSGSTGRIAEDIGRVLQGEGHESYIAFGRGNRPSESKLIRIGGELDAWAHGLKSILRDRHGFGSYSATEQLVKKIEAVQPDVIGLHNIHGYYLNVEVLFNFLKVANIPIVWTLHDCWAFTGHCAYYDFVGCRKWQTHCHQCPLTSRYPRSLFQDNSHQNFTDKRKLFQGLKNLHMVTPSHWLKTEVSKSFLSDYPVKVIHNGIDLDLFKITEASGPDTKIVLGVASTWDRIKGLGDFYYLHEHLPQDYKVVIIGVTRSQARAFPRGITAISRTESIPDLVKWYNRASVFVNPTYVDNFPTTNIEALACGTPVVTYATGGSPEAVDHDTGVVVARGDRAALLTAVTTIAGRGKSHFTTLCRRRAVELFNKEDRFRDYLQVYAAARGGVARGKNDG